MNTRLLRATAWAVMLLMVIAIGWAVYWIPTSQGWNFGFVVGLGLSLLILALAFWLTMKVPDNAVTWTIYLGVASALISQTAIDYVDAASEIELIGARLAFAAQLSVFWVGIVLLVVMFPLIFPTGRPPSPRWRWVVGLGLAGLLPQIVKAFYLAVTLPVSSLIDGDSGLSILDAAVFLGQGMVAIAGVAALLSTVVRYRRSAGAERQQIKWLLLPLTFLVLFWMVEAVMQEDTLLAISLLVAGAVTLPIAIGMAILKHRLYDIDRILSRTVSYALVVGLLAAVFFGVVTLVTALLQVQDDLAVAASTLAVAALFNPLRKRVQGWVDRRFNRSRYDAERVMEEFTGSLQDRVDPDGVVDGWVDVVTETMQPSAVSVWVRDGS